MNWEISYWPDDEIVYVKTQGTMTLALLTQMSEDALAEAAKRASVRILVDNRAMTHAITVIDIYHLPEQLRVLGLSPAHAVANVFSVDTEQKADFKFFDDRAYNSGLRHALFTDVEAAREWLMAQRLR